MLTLARIAVASVAVVGMTAVALCARQPTVAHLNGTWELAQMHTRPLQQIGANPLPTFTVTGDVIEGFDGCNKFWGRLDKPGGLASTRRGCVDDAVKLPLDLTDPKSHLEAGRLERDTLVLPARAGMPASTFRRVKPPRQ